MDILLNFLYGILGISAVFLFGYCMMNTPVMRYLGSAILSLGEQTPTKLEKFAGRVGTSIFFMLILLLVYYIGICFKALFLIIIS